MGGLILVSSSRAKNAVESLLSSAVRIETSAREEVKRRISDIEKELLLVAEEREKVFHMQLFERGQEDLPLRKITDKVFFSKERESFFFVVREPDEDVSVFDFRTLKKFSELPEMREITLRDPEFHKAVIGE